jgi:uncharacterized protein YegL
MGATPYPHFKKLFLSFQKLQILQKGDKKMIDNTLDRPLREASQAHVALVLVLDVSNSMNFDKKIDMLNKSVNKMVKEMKQDERLKNIVDLAIFVFGGENRNNIYQGFRAIADCADDIKLVARDKHTFIAPTLDKAIEMTRKRCAVYDQAGGSYKPWLILITDGDFHDEPPALREIATKIKSRESSGKHQFFGLGVKGYNRTQMEMFTHNDKHVIDVNAANFLEFFSWVGRSMKDISRKEIDEKIALEDLVLTGENGVVAPLKFTLEI